MMPTMSGSLPEPLAQGDLARTPFAHLLLHVMRQGLTGTLVLPNGRSFTGMSLLRFKPESAFDRGRTVSVAYRVDYIRL